MPPRVRRPQQPRSRRPSTGTKQTAADKANGDKTAAEKVVAGAQDAAKAAMAKATQADEATKKDPKNDGLKKAKVENTKGSMRAIKAAIQTYYLKKNRIPQSLSELCGPEGDEDRILESEAVTLFFSIPTSLAAMLADESAHDLSR